MIKGLQHTLNQLPRGTLPYSMTNDYLFRAVFQENQNALKGLLYALLSLPEESITSVVVLNPIVLGEAIDDKTCILDLKVCLNNEVIINIEMQVNDLGNWPERSLTYLCRSFDCLRKGQDYIEVPTTIHIGILDFALPHLTPEFYSEFKMMNTRNHEIYSSKFILCVLNLKMTANISLREEYGELYDWAVLFKTTEWSELKMLAEKNAYIADAVVTLHEMTAEEKIREQCEARERYNWDMAAAAEKGKREGRQEGRQEERAQISELLICLAKDKRLEELTRIQEDSQLLATLLAEYHL